MSRLVLTLASQMAPLPGDHCLAASACGGDGGRCPDGGGAEEAFADFRRRAGEGERYGAFLAGEALRAFGSASQSEGNETGYGKRETLNKRDSVRTSDRANSECLLQTREKIGHLFI